MARRPGRHFGTFETGWSRGFLQALQPHRAGVYVNFLGSDDDTSRVREAYGDDTYRSRAQVLSCHGNHELTLKMCVMDELRR
jgi:hypothetical protein